MASKDLKTCISVQPTILPQAATDDVTGVEVDTLGFEGVTLVGSLDDASAGSFKLQECAVSGGTFTDVAATDVITSDGTNDTAGVGSASVTLGYIGELRYVKAVYTETTPGDISANIILSHPHVKETGANS